MDFIWSLWREISQISEPTLSPLPTYALWLKQAAADDLKWYDELLNLEMKNNFPNIELRSWSQHINKISFEFAIRIQ